MSVVKWRFAEVWGEQFWHMPVNPNEGGSPTIEKEMNALSNAGPYLGAILQEGRTSVPKLSFSGVILAQDHYEDLERWHLKRVLLDLDDDLGRTFRGVLVSFSPQRTRRAFNPWYHTYTAEFVAWAYRNASGQVLFGAFE